MIESKFGRIVWEIKKEDFLTGKLDAAKYQLGNCVWTLSSNNENPIQDDFVSLKLACPLKSKSKCILSTCWQSSGSICLKGLSGRFNVAKSWHCGNRDVQLKVDTSVFSFDEKYLFPDGTYHIGFNVEQDSSFVDFESANHPLILGPTDAVYLQIEERKVYISKTYFAAQSPYFKALFFGGSAERNQKGLVLTDVKFETFKEFLKHLYAEFHFLYRNNHAAIPEVLALADIFLCNTVTRSCEFMLAEKKSPSVADLELADKHRLYRLRTKCVAELPVVELKTYLAKILDTPESKCSRDLILERIEQEARR